MSKSKKIIIGVCVVICLCVASFCAGRYRRLGVLESSSAGIDITYTELAESLSRTQSELELRIEECADYERRLDNIGSDINDCLGIVRQVRGDCDIAGVETAELKSLLKELRNRFELISYRNQELEERLIKYATSSD